MRKRKRESCLVAWLNRLKLKQKLRIMQIFCVILPLLLTDSVIISIIMRAERRANLQDIYKNREVNEFISNTYSSPLDYYNQHLNFVNISLFCLLLFLNIFLPFVLMELINRSFTQRLRELEAVLGSVEKDELYQLPGISGTDEISLLMKAYNEMAERMNNLIQNEYKSRLKRQEHDIARQKAELLALHSQINPHFLFNALESIHMHCVIKGEFETADMVEKLAVMQRQNVVWGNDYVSVEEEADFVKAYLELQKYRFGSRLCYEISVDGECGQYRLPRLTLVTFVENACVHGMEKKESSCWVFVRVFCHGEYLTLEVEDTGQGMPEEKCRSLVEEMNGACIEMLQENRSVGILNAALRLKLFLDGQVRFEMDSETGVGTLVAIRIPLEVAEWRRS